MRSSGAGILVIGNGKIKFLLFLIQQDDRSAPDRQQFLNFLDDELQAILQPAKLIQRIGDAKKGLIDPRHPFFLGHIPKGNHLTGGPVLIIVKNGPIHHDIQQPSVPGQALGFKSVNGFFAVKFFDSQPGLLFCGFRHKGDDFSFKFRQ